MLEGVSNIITYESQDGAKALNQIEQGESFSFTATPSDSDVSGLTAVMNVLQYPGDTPAITRSISLNSNNQFEGTITSAETAALAVGQWTIHIKASDTGEDIREPIKLYVSEGWL